MDGGYQQLADRANVLWLDDRPTEALPLYQRAVQLAPDDPIVYRGLGNVYVDLGLFEAADRAYRMSSARASSADTDWNHSQVLLGLERYEQALALAEARWQLERVTPFRPMGCACRDRDQLRRGPLRLWSEQGLGDTLQHLRWIGPLLAGRDPGSDPVVLEVEPCLVQLLQGSLLPGDPRLQVGAKQPGPPPQPFLPHLPLMSLPHLLGGVPLPEGASWLNHRRGSASSRPATRAHLGPGARVGIVWAAGRKLEDPFQRREYQRRSLTLEALEGLVTTVRAAGMVPVNLQFGPDRDAGLALEPGFDETLAADADFGSTAELVASLDLVISVDTAMAHLVGAMGRPGWILLPRAAAPRWLRNRQDTPWYPSLRLFRQEHAGQWAGVVEAVGRELTAAER